MGVSVISLVNLCLLHLTSEGVRVRIGEKLFLGLAAAMIPLYAPSSTMQGVMTPLNFEEMFMVLFFEV